MLTQEILKEVLSYNEDTGVFVRLKNFQGGRGTSAVGHMHHTGYLRIMVAGERHQAHRLAWLYVYGEWPEKHIDHINHNKTDNRISNLRCVTPKENNKNRTIASNNKSGVSGVAWHTRDKIWQASISVNGKFTYIGRSMSKFEAICMRKSAEIKHGFHANHGDNRIEVDK